MGQKNQYIDISAIIKYKTQKHERISWEISHEVYNNLYSDIYTSFQLYFQKLDSENKEKIKLVEPLICAQLTAYLSLLLDERSVRKKNIIPLYTDESKSFKAIYEKEPAFEFLNKANFVKKGKWKDLKWYYSFLIKFYPTFLVKNIIISKNYLHKQNLLKFSKYNNLIFLLNYYIDENKKVDTKEITDTFSTLINDIFNKKYFTLTEKEQKVLNNIIESNINRAFSTIENFNNIFKKFEDKVVITSTGTNFYNRVSSYFAKKQNLRVIRAAHGGNYSFSIAKPFDEFDIYESDEYICHGKKEAKMLSSKYPYIKFIAIGSQKHQAIYDKYFGKKVQGDEIVYFSNSYHGESRQFPCTKHIDPIYFDFQVYLLNIMRNHSIEVILKQHPKGYFSNSKYFESEKFKVSYINTFDALAYGEKVIFDMMGSAFVEALCAGKDMIFIDFGFRKFSDELLTFCKIVNVEYKENIPYIDIRQLEQYLKTEHKNIEKQRKFVIEYFLEPSKDLNECKE